MQAYLIPNVENRLGFGPRLIHLFFAAAVAERAYTAADL
jgi:hypothetical protein